VRSPLCKTKAQHLGLFVCRLHVFGRGMNRPAYRSAGKNMKTLKKLAIGVFAGLTFNQAMACASCGCSLSTDWQGQGMTTSQGWHLDLRHDLVNQNQMRSGTGTAATSSATEQELYTRNHYTSVGLDYNWNETWGIQLQLPYIDRDHATNGEDGSTWSASHTQSLGDIKLVMRYAGLEDDSIGLQFGLKLPTGSFTQNFASGDAAGTVLDRGLQPGSGTTDAILGVYKTGSLSQNWDYFSQAVAQLPLNSRDDYKPGNALNLNLGFSYMGLESVTPQLQLNARVSAKDSGSQATPDDSGGQTLYLSPGVSVPVNDKLKLYGFVQLPIYQNLNGYQLAPTYTASVGLQLAF
jgi:hypothetical protein